MKKLSESKEREKFAQLVQKIDPQSKLLRKWELKGGVSALVTALEMGLPDGQTKKMIVRQHGEADLKRNPNVAADEFKLLQILKSVGLLIPTPYYYDESGDILSKPCLVLEFIEGQTPFSFFSIKNDRFIVRSFFIVVFFFRRGWLSIETTFFYNAILADSLL
jgi:aminoglycoside phosphotransferase (APT) family kinase protein